MFKKIIILFLSILLFLVLAILYLSHFGVETKRFNHIIENKISETNEKINVKLQKVNLILDLTGFNLKVQTQNPFIFYDNKKLELKTIEINFSIKSFLNNEFAVKNLAIKTKENNIKDVINFIRIYKNTPQLIIFSKIVKEGKLESNINLNLDNKGKFSNNYNISGFIKNGKIELFNKQIINNINLNFKINKNQYQINNSKIEFKNIQATSEKIIVNKEKNYFLLKGDFKTSEDLINKEFLSYFLKNNMEESNISDINLGSDNNFSFKIDKKFKITDIHFKSKINLKKLIYKNKNLTIKKYIPNYKNIIELNNHEIKLDFNQNQLSIHGEGNFLISEKPEKVSYDVNLNNKGEYKFKSSAELKNNSLIIKILDYTKTDNKNGIFNLEGSYKKNDFLNFKNISFKENQNNFVIKGLSLNDRLKINHLNEINLKYLNDNKKNISAFLKRDKKNYLISGKNFDAKIIVDEILNSEEGNNIFNNFNNLNSELKIDLDRIYIDNINYLKNFNGNIKFKKNNLNDLDLLGKFANNKRFSLTIKTNKNNEKITTLFSDNAEPLVKKYKFIKGFEEGYLDFYSIKKNNISKSQLKIHNFKLQELPALTKLLTLASLQGIADLLTGEGIRFTDFEMNFSNKKNLMTIDEIYAIGPAISILMEGYIQNKKLVSLRGTLVPATTINKAIGSIPLLGNILVGKKVGEGVFGVSFKIKGPPKDLNTTVNPIKTLTPRFITRTLEKIKKNN